MFKPMLKIEDAKTAKDAMELVEQVLDTIGEYGNGVSDDDIIGAYSKLIKARDLLDEESMDSVEERFPEEGESVLVSFRGSGFQPVIAFIQNQEDGLCYKGPKVITISRMMSSHGALFQSHTARKGVENDYR